MIVTDVFGDRLLVKAADEKLGDGEKGWSMFRLSNVSVPGQPPTVTDFLFLPPSLGSSSIDGPEIEKVYLIRDEMANMVWAVEHSYENELGKTVSAYESNITTKSTGNESLVNPKYVMQTNVPMNWIPFLPVHIQGTNRAVDLQLGSMNDFWSETSSTPSRPRTRLLQYQNNEKYMIKEEEIPRAGIFVTRSYQRARWIDGSTHVWIGKHKGTGRGEGSSGLRFDVLESSQQD